MTLSKEDLTARVAELAHKCGPWSHDILLPHGVRTAGFGGSHKLMRRLLQIVVDLCPKPLSECRVLDLACLEGQFAIEFALHGAACVGVEGRAQNVEKATFCKDALGLSQLEFVVDDVRNVTLEKYGRFDVVLCSGILYHLDVPDIFSLIEKQFALVNHLLVVDTHVAFKSFRTEEYKGHLYGGGRFREHDDHDTSETKLSRALASLDNVTSFWLTRPSLVNFLEHVGFSSVYECFNPVCLHKPHFHPGDRSTFVAVKGQKPRPLSHDFAMEPREEWSESDLRYTESS